MSTEDSTGHAGEAPGSAPTASGSIGLLDRLLQGLGRRRTLKIVLLFMFAFSPAILTGYLVATNAVNIPTWDDWEIGDLVERYYEGRLDFQYLYSPHIDHRMLFPRLMILGLSEIAGGDFRAEIYAIYITVLAGALALFFLIRRTLEGRDSTYVVAFLVNLIIFSPLQYQNLLWPIQIAFVLPLACLSVVLLTMGSRLKLWLKFLVCLFAVIVGTHSFAHGLILWPVTICLALFQKDFAPLKSRLVFVGAFLLCAGTVITFYFTWHFETSSTHGYGSMPGEAPPGLKHAADVGENLDKIVRYALGLLGSPFARVFHSDPLESTRNTGRTAAILFLGLLGWMLWQWRKKTPHWDRLLPWAAAGFYALSAASIIAFGRFHMSPERALLTRYTSNTMYLYTAIVVMAAYVLHQWKGRARGEAIAERRLRVAIGLAAACAMLHLPQWVYGIHKMEAWRLARLQERVDVLYLNHFTPDYRYLGRLDRIVEFPRKYANYLTDKGLMDPALFEKPDFGAFEKVSGRLPEQWSRITRARLVGSDSLRIDGFATLDGDGEIAHGVLLTYRAPGGDWTVFALGDLKSMPAMRAMFLDGHFGAERDYGHIEEYALWTKTVPLEDLPGGKIEIQAWALDAARMRAHPMGPGVRLDRTGVAPEVTISR